MTKTSRRLTVTSLAAVAALACALPAALAAWTAVSSGATAAAKAATLAPVTGLAATATASSVTLTWAAGAGAAPTAYTVTRTAPTAGVVCASTTPATCTDAGLAAGTRHSYAVVALRHGWTSAAAALDATTGGVAALTFALTPAAGPYTAGSAFPVAVQARVGGINDVAYTGTRTLSITAPTAPNGTSSAALGATTATFDANGRATVQVTLYAAGARTFTIADASPATRTGSAGVTVGAGAPARLAFTSMSISSQNVITANRACLFGCTVGGLGNDPTVSARVSVVDTWGNTVSNLGSALTVSMTKTAGNAIVNPSLTVPATGLAQSGTAWTWSAGSASYDAVVTAGSTSTYTQVAARFLKN